MSRFPPQGYYPPSLPYQPHYANPDRPLPYRGDPSSNPRSPTSVMSYSNSIREELEDASLEDGGWGQAGPLFQARDIAAARKRGHRGMNSYDKTAGWLKHSPYGYTAMAPEQPTATPQEVESPIPSMANLSMSDERQALVTSEGESNQSQAESTTTRNDIAVLAEQHQAETISASNIKAAVLSSISSTITSEQPAEASSGARSLTSKASTAASLDAEDPILAPSNAGERSNNEAKKEQIDQALKDTSIVIGPDGWPIEHDTTDITSADGGHHDNAIAVESTTKIVPTQDTLPEIGGNNQVSLAPAQPHPPVSQGYIYRQYHPTHLQPPWRDPNVLSVVNPRQWGAGDASTAQTPGSGQAAIPQEHEVWSADASLVEWREQVSRTSASTMSQESYVVAEDVNDEGPDRPDSAPPLPPPVTAYVSSEEESITSTPRQSTVEVPSMITPPPLHDTAGTPPVSDSDTANTPPPLVRDNSPSSEEPLPTPTGPSESRTRMPSINHVEVNGQVVQSPPRVPRPRRVNGPGSGGAWWKRDSHPAYNVEFSSRRLLVMFPFPIRLDRIRPIMGDHFSKYGTIRMISPRDVTNDAADKAIVVFWHEESIDNCFADPNRNDCISKSYPTSSRFDIQIERFPCQTSSTLYIKFTGSRWDHRSRSASPPSRPATAAPTQAQYEDTRSMPEYLTMWGIPEYNRRTHRIEWRASVVVGEAPADMKVRQVLQDTGSEPAFIERIELGRRVPQRDLVPKLCDFFTDIIEVKPPRRAEHGWLVCINGHRDGDRIINELSNVNGITVRWAESSDNQDSPQRPSPSTNVGRRTASAASHLNLTDAAGSPPVTTQASVVDPNEPAPVSPLSARSLPSEYPHLTKNLVPTYKGRLLKEEHVNGGSRFVDECAVFVGRLVKEKETPISLFQRFAKYGRICGIEYNPHNSPNTYGTARILYGERTSADRALQYECHAVSFGSGLKIETRKVLPHDVEMREMYIDEFGRPVSPSMASQYSPPHEHTVPVYPLPPVLPCPPLSVPMTPPHADGAEAFSGPAPPPPDSSGPPHPNFFPVYFGHSAQAVGGPVPPPMGMGPAMPMFGVPWPPLAHQGVEGGPHGHPITPFFHAQNDVGVATSEHHLPQLHPGQNVGYVPIYPTIPFTPQEHNVLPTIKSTSIPPIHGLDSSTGATAGSQPRHRRPSLPSGQLQPRYRSPSLPSIHSQQSVKAEGSIQPSQSQSVSSGSRSGSGSVLRAVELREEKGVLKAVYDPEDLRRYQEERGYVNSNSNPNPLSAEINHPVLDADNTLYQDSAAPSGVSGDQDTEIIRPQSSPQFGPRVDIESGSQDEYITMARRGSLAPAHLVRQRQREVVTPIPIPFRDSQPPYSPQGYSGQDQPVFRPPRYPYPVGQSAPQGQHHQYQHHQHGSEQQRPWGPGW